MRTVITQFSRREPYLKLHDQIVRHRRPILMAIGTLLIVAFPLLLKMEFDMSFRPLFAEQDRLHEATTEFEKVLGQPSGAYIGVVLESDSILTPAFLSALSSVSDNVASLNHVIEVVSLTNFHYPIWTDRGISVVPLIPAAILNDHKALAKSLKKIRSHPKVRRVILSEDGQKTLLLARLGLPLSDLKERRKVIKQFRTAVSTGAPPGTELRFTGVSVVEDAYAGLVLKNLLKSISLTLVFLIIALYLFFRRIADVVIALAGISMATPITIAIMHLLGQKITIVNSMVPTMILIIGVADAIHMQQSCLQHRAQGLNIHEAVRNMFGDMGFPCLMTTVTTIIGFMSLGMANIRAIRDFGLNVSIGVLTIYLMNLVFIPLLLRLFHKQNDDCTAGSASWIDGLVQGSTYVVTRYPGRIVTVSALMIVGCLSTLPYLSLDQKFNEEVRPEHPVRFNQALLEREFSGFLGPEISVQRKDRSTLLNEDRIARIRSFQQEIADLPDVIRVRSLVDYLPKAMPTDKARDTLLKLRNTPALRHQLGELISEDGSRAGVLVRTGDMGTERAQLFKTWLAKAAAGHFGQAYEVEMVGQWWLAQSGMINILHDMLWSFGTACLMILPIMALLLRSVRLFLVSLLPNILPLVAALGFMAATGISVRIGTAMILAIALGIAIDDTIHFMIRLHKETTLMKAPEHCVRRAISHVGRAIIYTSVVLILGFISMVSNDLIAIRDMGIVAAVTVGVALFSDVYLAPALFLLALGTSRTPRLGVQHMENGDDFLSRLTQRIPSPCRVRRGNTD